MNAQAQLQAPASLIEQLGTGEDTLGILGKQVRVTKDPSADVPDLLVALFGRPPSLPIGAVATVVHVDADGVYWGHFGDDERIAGQGPEQVRIYDVASVDDEEEDRFIEVIA